jgi:hypothetical protein
MYKDNCVMLKAASKDADVANISIKQNGSIEINTPTQTFVASESLSKEEIEKISTFITKTQETTEDKSASMVEKFLEKIFGSKKEATHPIKNQSGQKDFSISSENYSDIQIRDRHNVLDQNIGIGTSTPCLQLNVSPSDIILQIIPIANKEEVSRVEEFECLKCGFKSELWKVKAASIDAGHKNILECPQCFFATETSFYVTSAKRKFKIKDKVKVISKKDKNTEGEITAFRGPLYILKTDKNKIMWKTEADLEKIEEKKKASIFVVSQDIPVENDEGTYWFDELGNSVITKGEKVSFVTTVENGSYGLFVTETGEDFFMPMSRLSSSKKF